MYSISITIDYGRKVKSSHETSKFVDQELCGLKAFYKDMKKDLNDVHNDFIKTCDQRDRYKEKTDDLCKLV